VAGVTIAPTEPVITSGAFFARFVFDVADTIDLTKLGSIAGESTEPALFYGRSLRQ